jgi:ribose 5-phosphate isomerase
MAAFFEIHDSQLKGVSWNGNRLSLRLHAVRDQWANGIGVGTGKTYYQDIELLIQGAKMEPDSLNLPVWLLNGAYKAAAQIANAEDIEEDCIPVSLVRADGIELQLEGMNEDTQEYITIKAQGESMSLAILGEPEFLQDFPAST